MKRRKTDNEKELRKLWSEYNNSWKVSKERGQYVEVEPYQSGWIRYFIPRQDIKNRTDIRWIRQALDLINNTRFCHNKDFIVKDSKGKYVPIEQRLGSISEEKYESLVQNVKKLFEKRQFVQKYSKQIYFRYCFKLEWYFEYQIEPNIVTHHWMPDPEWETHVAEISHRIGRNNLWPKINRMLGSSTKYKEWRLSPKLKNKYGMYFSEEDYDVIDVENV